MTRSSSKELFEFDPEIDRTFHQRRRAQASNLIESDSSVKLTADSSNSPDSSHSDSSIANPARTIKELVSPDLHFQNWCINYPDIDTDFELKSRLIHFLPKFNGLAGEDLYNHLKTFHMICTAMKPSGVSEDQIKMRAFPFSLESSAKNWLLRLPPGFITSWDQLKRLFLEKYFPASRLLPLERDLLDSDAGGALLDLTVEAAWRLIEKKAENTQQFATHTTDSCPYLNDGVDSCNAIYHTKPVTQGGQKYDPYLNTYNLGWRDHPNLRYGSGQPQQSQFNQVINSSGGKMFQQVRQTMPNQDESLKLEGMMKLLMDKFEQKDLQHSQEIQNLQTQIGQLSNALSNMQSQGSGKLPSQVVVNPNVGTQQNPNVGGVNAISLRSGNSITSSDPVTTHTSTDKEAIIKDSPPASTSHNKSTLSKPHVALQEEQEKDGEGKKVSEQILPFPTGVIRAERRKKEAEMFKEVYDIFKKVVINVPLVDLVAQVPKYAKFLKELCTTKKRLKHDGKVDLGAVVSSLYQMPMPVK
ncbi:uncharacterized protein LOC114733173 [Neltuma alba]|uniref:uncharacterized protein LOC114733173 n=1 Tax=Neltuma alba TaxID=207710 RepID=UPI0010A4D29B|nr:uncharacterized protein LOC114733173 [Prosopis alba]